MARNGKNARAGALTFTSAETREIMQALMVLIRESTVGRPYAESALAKLRAHLGGRKNK